MSGGPVPIWKKYTSGSVGLWEKLRQLLVLVPNRSTGNPVPSLYRKLPPGERIEDARNYEDPITIPAGDIVNNRYHKRDYRRNYPRVIAFNQTKVSGLLQLGSASNPRISVGDKGSKELAVFVDPTKQVSLASTLNTVSPSVIKNEVLGPQGGPVVAPALKKFKWSILREPQHGMFTEEYPCRMFTDVKSSQ